MSKNGLYSIGIEMQNGKRGRATGVVILSDGRILGGDTHFYYTGSYSFKNCKWRGELIAHQHTEAVGVLSFLTARCRGGLAQGWNS
jgi:T3SS negative regulator,GrlR